MGRFVALEGIDGCGKTTLAAAVTRPGAAGPTQDAAPIRFVSRRTVPAGDGFVANLMRQHAQMLWHSGDATDLSPEFWVTLQASWYTAMSDALLGPALAAGDNVLVDGWMYKFWSKLLNQGYTLAELQIIFRGARIPDLVVLLEVDAAAVYDRHRNFRPTELGMHAGYAALNRASFIDYQSRGQAHLRRLAEDHGWLVLTVPADEPLELTSGRLGGLIGSALTPVTLR